MSEKIPIVFLTPSLFGTVNNGPATYAQYLWDAFSDHDLFDFHLVSPQSHLEHAKIHTSGLFSSSKKQYLELQKLALKVAKELGKGNQLPIVHSNTAHTMWHFKNYAGPTIAQVNDYDATDVFENLIDNCKIYGPRRIASLVFRHFKERQATRFLTKVVCNSQFTKKRVQAAYGIEPTDKAIVVYKAVDVDAFDATKPFSPFGQELIGGRKVLFVGSNWHRKGLDNLIEAIQLLPKEFSDVCLIVAGAQGQKADNKIRLLPKRLGIADRVQFLGRVNREELLPLLAEVDIFSLPSRQEALGVAILEALAAGLPVLGTQVGGIPEILTQLESPSLVDPNAPKQLCCELMRMLSGQNQHLTKDSIDVAYKFTKSKMVESLQALYLDLWSKPTK